jgi:hypothetical protein
VYLKQVCEIFDVNNFLGVSAKNVQPWKKSFAFNMLYIFFFKIHNTVVPSLNTSGAIPPLPLCTFMVLTKLYLLYV